jgi:D-glycero-alpha-D-manno-heptose-7-phosphate kinase
MIISRTPVRVSFFGGGTDYPGFYKREQGLVLGSTIDKYVYVSVNRNSRFFDYTTRVSYRRTELVTSLDDIEHPSVKACLKFMQVDDPLDINIFSDLPARTGLGSSSAFTVGLLNALYALKGRAVTPKRLSEEACHIEQVLIGENVGSQDQYHAAHGGLNVISFSNDDCSVEPVVTSAEKISKLQDGWMMFFTGITRFADPLLKEQVERTAAGQNDGQLLTMLDYVKRGRTIFSDAATESFLSDFGHLLDEAWELKKRLSSKVSNELIDTYYCKAIQAGALGGKLSGAGAGGFLSFIVPPENKQAVRAALSDLKELSFKIDSRGSTIIYSNE